MTETLKQAQMPDEAKECFDIVRKVQNKAYKLEYNLAMVINNLKNGCTAERILKWIEEKDENHTLKTIDLTLADVLFSDKNTPPPSSVIDSDAGVLPAWDVITDKGEKIDTMWRAEDFKPAPDAKPVTVDIEVLKSDVWYEIGKHCPKCNVSYAVDFIMNHLAATYPAGLIIKGNE